MIQIREVNLLVLMYSVQTRFILKIEQERMPQGSGSGSPYVADLYGLPIATASD
jgi:hypothetical protein